MNNNDPNALECAICEREYFHEQSQSDRPNICSKCYADETKQDNVPQVKSVEEIPSAESAAGLLADIDIFRVLKLPNEAINRINLFVSSHTEPLQSRIAELEAERDKYRQALEWISNEWYQGSQDKSTRTDIPLLNKIAEALNSKEVG